MKTSTFLLIAVAIMVAFIVGRYLERLALIQNEICELNNRILKLEECKKRTDERWGWLFRIGVHIPIVNKFLT